MIVFARWLQSQPWDLLADILLDFCTRLPQDREHTYCVCFQDGTFTCRDCQTASNCRTVHELIKTPVELTVSDLVR